MSNVTEIRYVGYGLPDVETERAFYREVWGLKEVAERDGMVYFATEGNEELYVVRLRHAEDKRIDIVALATANRTDVDALHDKVVAAGCEIIFAPRELEGYGGGYGFRFFSADGMPFETPARIDRASGEFLEPGLVLPPPPNGTRIRVLDIPPETEDFKEITEEESREHFAAIGMEDASTGTKGAPHPFMHRTRSVDYGIILEGELVLIMDEGETTCHAGDIVVQRGTNHAWSNRSDRNCKVAFILIDGEFTDGLA